MRVSFIATEGAFITEFEAFICGVTDGDHYLTFQRATQDSDDDWGIHLEYDDQCNSGYNCIAQCHCSSHCLSVDLARPLGNRREITGFDVTLNLYADQLVAVRTGLPQIFRGQDELLTIT